MEWRERLLAFVRADFPALTITSARGADSGWDNHVVVINDEYIFRFPKDDEVDLEREMDVLNCLRGKTTLAIPVVEFVGRSARYMGYRRISGAPLTPERLAHVDESARKTIAEDLATFLFEVHRAIPLDLATQLGLELDAHESYLREARSLRGRISDSAMVRIIDATVNEAERALAVPAAVSFLYNDLHGDNMAFDADRCHLNGIFDFGDAAIGDVHRDLAPLYGLDPSLFETTVAAYEQMTGLSLSLRRMVLLHRLERLADLSETLDQPKHREPARVLSEIRRWMVDPNVYSTQS